MHDQPRKVIGFLLSLCSNFLRNQCLEFAMINYTAEGETKDKGTHVITQCANENAYRQRPQIIRRMRDESKCSLSNSYVFCSCMFLELKPQKEPLGGKATQYSVTQHTAEHVRMQKSLRTRVSLKK